MQSMYEKDWFMRQIKLMVSAIAKIAFGKDEAVYEVSDYSNQTATDELYLCLLRMIGDGKINEAEELLFEALHPGDHQLLLVALDFYQRLNALGDEDLESMNFTRREIAEGLREVQTLYGLAL